MKKSVLFLSLLLVFSLKSLNAQSPVIHHISTLGPIETERIKRLDPANVIYLKTDFATPEILNPEALHNIGGRAITRIDLVYSKCRVSQDFDQVRLNKNRLMALERIAPELFEMAPIEWRIIAQTDCEGSEGGHRLFHGFVIYCRAHPTDESMKEEIARLEDLLKTIDPKEPVEAFSETGRKTKKKKEGYCELNDDEVNPDGIIIHYNRHRKYKVNPRYMEGGRKGFRNYLLANISYPEKYLKDSLDRYIYVDFVVQRNGTITGISTVGEVEREFKLAAMPAFRNMGQWKPGKKGWFRTTSTVRVMVHFRSNGEIEFIDRRTPCPEEDDEDVVSRPRRRYVPIMYSPVDSTVLKVFERNPQWDSLLVVCDFTGSMYPYTSQLLLWHKLNFNLNQNKAQYFTFFNDGDRMSDSKKKIGDTGGIYHTKADSFGDVASLAIITMHNGSGGDCPENNLEATIEGINQCEDCKEVVMIADNYATPRDLELISKIDRPIHIILCGAAFGINTDYLDLVRKNGGTIHTMESDLENLVALNEGESFELNGVKYVIKGGEFVRTY